MDKKYRLRLHLSIVTSESCVDCRNKAKESIEKMLLPFEIPLHGNSIHIVQLKRPIINSTNIINKSTTSKSNCHL